MDKITIRPSGISGFFDCAYKWFRDNIDRPIRRIGSAAHIGTSIHKAAETYYNECINSKKWIKYSTDLEGVAIDTFREKVKEDEPTDIKELAAPTIENLLRNNVKAYLQNSEKLNKAKLPIATEKTYSCDLNSKLVKKVTGTLDVVGEDYIVDIKTMSKLKSPKNYLNQQATYALLRTLHNEQVNDLRIHRIVTTKNTVDNVSILDEMYTPIDKLMQKAKDNITIIVKTCDLFAQTGNEYIFRGNPTSLFCSEKYCAYYDECRFKNGV